MLQGEATTGKPPGEKWEMGNCAGESRYLQNASYRLKTQDFIRLPHIFVEGCILYTTTAGHFPDQSVPLLSTSAVLFWAGSAGYPPGSTSGAQTPNMEIIWKHLRNLSGSLMDFNGIYMSYVFNVSLYDIKINSYDFIYILILCHMMSLYASVLVIWCYMYCATLICTPSSWLWLCAGVPSMRGAAPDTSPEKKYDGPREKKLKDS